MEGTDHCRNNVRALNLTKKQLTDGLLCRFLQPKIESEQQNKHQIWHW
jgi:hypothetical protein